MVINNRSSHFDQPLLDSICAALVSSGQDEKAGDLYQQQRRFGEAKDAYRR